MLKFSKSHEWVKLEGDQAVVGISDYAQSQLGDIVFVELPKAGDKLTQFSQLGTIESTKAASEIYSPVSGADSYRVFSDSLRRSHLPYPCNIERAFLNNPAGIGDIQYCLFEN